MKRTQSFYVQPSKRTRTMSVKSLGPRLATSPGANLSYSADGAKRIGKFKFDSKSKVKGVSKALQKAIKAVIATTAERKFLITQANSGATVTINTTAVATPPAFISLVGNIPVGNGQGSRISNDVRVMDSKVTYRLMIPATQTNMPAYYVTVWIGNLKASATATPTISDFIKLLHQSATVETGEYTQSADTGMLPVNEEWWNIMSRKTYKLGPSNCGTSGGENNDTRAYYEDTVDVPYLNGLWRYDDGAAFPQNKNAFAFVTMMPCNASIALPVVQPLYLLNYSCSFIDP